MKCRQCDQPAVEKGAGSQLQLCPEHAKQHYKDIKNERYYLMEKFDREFKNMKRLPEARDIMKLHSSSKILRVLSGVIDRTYSGDTKDLKYFRKNY